MALTDNLISYWKLDEASGNALDAHSTNDLTDTNTVGSATGKINNGRDFEDGSNEYFVRADNAALSTGDIDFTLTAWVNMESKSDFNYIAAKSDASSGDEFRLLYRPTNDRFRFSIVYNGGASEVPVDADNLGSPSTATWYFIVAWHDAANNTLNIQVNDGTVNSVATSGNAPPDGGGDFYIGAYHSSLPLSMDGIIDEFGFWKRVLTSQERTDLHNSGNGLSYDDFDGGVDTGASNDIDSYILCA